MVAWINNIDQSKVGYKATNLDQIQGFNVPNFYAITREETKEATKDSTNPREILNNDLQQEKVGEWEKAFKELGISNEVRNSSGKARNLVSGQRNNVKASVRISEQPGQVFQKELNVTRSDLEQKIKELIANYHQNKTEDAPRHPSIIIQKMIEPEHTGVLTLNYRGNSNLLEIVPGLGTTIENASTRPEIHIINEEQILSRVPKTQTREEKHPVNGSTRQKKVQRDQPALDKSEIKKLTGKIENQQYNVKFVYKRGTFYIVDATKADDSNPFTEDQQSTTGVRASKGEIKGRIGQQIRVKDTANQLNPNPSLILHKGSYQSDIAQKARQKQIPLIVNYNKQLQEGQQIQLGKTEIKIQSKTPKNTQKTGRETSNREKVRSQHKEQKTSRNGQTRKENQNRNQGNLTTASQTLPLNAKNGITLSQPHYNSIYAVSDNKTPAETTITTENYLTSYQEIFQRGKQKAEIKIVDSRKMDKQALENALKYIEAEQKILILEEIDKKILETAIDQDYTYFATTKHKMPELEKKLEQSERKYIIDGIRELKNQE